MCTKCDAFDKHAETLKAIIKEYPATKERLQGIIDFLYIEQDIYVDDAVERDLRD